MHYEIKNVQKIEKGNYFTVLASGNEINILVTHHCEFRRQKWSIERIKLFETILYPEEVIEGHHSRFIAQRRYNNHIVRLVYEYENEIPVLITVYYPYKKQYFEGGGQFADKIL